ncbi:hypothetical protein LOTGIDRAFT_209340 [Lottia gigantea]|uniref:Alpha-galactosidase n=1 Tax=Lottia gigantea TaxID=225164 RepID=V4AF69_LOTGI|nr:hypothetical protein LOTGIDRAFT_209340 [Lottia gigantea]ESO93810.1 hypothetical protein LOTGIDRAFT_209340 [Lottia gigantea]
MKLLEILVGILCVGYVSSLDNGLGLTPPMGWLSWERFRCNIDCTNDPDNCISEKLYMSMADRLAEDGYRDVGYEYVNIDDCWSSKQRDSKGRLVADPDRFPSGIKALADYVHNKGLKLGIYGDFGTFTCGGYPGSEFYMELDAQTFADWGIDSLKLDGCYARISDMPFGYPVMELYLNQTGRPILYSCSWPAYTAHPNYPAIAKSCNIWRNYGDIQDSYSSLASIIEFYGKNEGNFSEVAGPGRFNDPDMLIIGDFSLSYYQQRLQMVMWAIMASPLYMSNDLRQVPEQSKEILQNKNVIAINQDPLGIQGKRVDKVNDYEIWVRPLAKSNYAFAAINLSGSSPSNVSLPLAKYGLTSTGGYLITEGFTGDKVVVYKPHQMFTTKVNPDDVSFYKATKL